MSSGLEVASNGTKGRKKALRLFCGFEAPHFLLSQSRRLVGVLSTIVETFVLTMLHSWQDLAFRRPITLQFVSNDHARHVLQPFEQFPKESLGGLFVASALQQDIKHVPILINGSPQRVFLPPDRQYHLVHVPFVAATRTTTTQFIRIGLTKFEAPLPHRFIGHDDPALCQKLLDIAKTE